MRQLQLDFNSYKPIEQQKEEGMKFLRKHCLESLQEAMLEYQLRVQAAKEEWRDGRELVRSFRTTQKMVSEPTRTITLYAKFTIH